MITNISNEKSKHGSLSLYIIINLLFYIKIQYIRYSQYNSNKWHFNNYYLILPYYLYLQLEIVQIYIKFMVIE